MAGLAVDLWTSSEHRGLRLLDHHSLTHDPVYVLEVGSCLALVLALLGAVLTRRALRTSRALLWLAMSVLGGAVGLFGFWFFHPPVNDLPYKGGVSGLTHGSPTPPYTKFHTGNGSPGTSGDGQAIGPGTLGIPSDAQVIYSHAAPPPGVRLYSWETVNGKKVYTVYVH